MPSSSSAPPAGESCTENSSQKRSGFAGSEHLLKRERIPRRTYRTRAEARRYMFIYIKMFCNPTRKHPRNGMLSPVDLQRQQEMKAEGV